MLSSNRKPFLLEVGRRLAMRFLSLAISLIVALLVMAAFPPVAVGQTP
jgi:hypothetical protein